MGGGVYWGGIYMGWGMAVAALAGLWVELQLLLLEVVPSEFLLFLGLFLGCYLPDEGFALVLWLLLWFSCVFLQWNVVGDCPIDVWKIRCFVFLLLLVFVELL